MSEYNKKGVVLDHNFPVVPIILMVFSLICAFIPLAASVGYQGFMPYLYFVCMLLVFATLVLHRVKMQILAGIGTLVIAAYNLYEAFNMIWYTVNYGSSGYIIFYMLIYLLGAAAFTVTGLHCVLRRPRPGKSAKLLLMIPLTCLWIIQLIINLVSGYASSSGFTPAYLMLNCVGDILLAFALMIYTPFREA